MGYKYSGEIGDEYKPATIFVRAGLAVAILAICLIIFGCAFQIGVGNRNVASDGKQIKGIESTLEDALNLKGTSIGNANQAEIGTNEQSIEGDTNEESTSSDTPDGWYEFYIVPDGGLGI